MGQTIVLNKDFLTKTRLSEWETYPCKQNGKEYYLEPNGGSLVVDNEDILSAVQGGNYRVVAQSARDGGGGGGGGPYPDKITIVSTSRQLVEADQGYIVVTTPGLIITLPDSTEAQNGWTYKFFDASGNLQIDTNGEIVFGFGVGVYQPGKKQLNLVAGNVGTFAWLISNFVPIQNWDAAEIYLQGEIVQEGADHWLCVAQNVTPGIQPGTDANKWSLLMTKTSITGYTNQTVNRDFNTTYQNTDATPRIIMVSMSMPSDLNLGNIGVAVLYVDGLEICRAYPPTITGETVAIVDTPGIVNLTAIIPAGSDYQLSNGGSSLGFEPYDVKWFEAKF